jgi:hypothetical protein
MTPVLPTQRIAHPNYGRRTAALRDFDPAHVRFGSVATEAVEATRACMSAVARKRTNSRSCRYVRFVPFELVHGLGL